MQVIATGDTSLAISNRLFNRKLNHQYVIRNGLCVLALDNIPSGLCDAKEFILFFPFKLIIPATQF